MKRGPRFLILLCLSIIAGLSLALLDSRQVWDDTGITSGLIVLTTALFGYLEPKQHWIWALTVSCWIPLFAIFLTGDYKMLLVTLFGFAGAYLGAAVKKNKPGSE
jgi:hypothetical protein